MCVCGCVGVCVGVCLPVCLFMCMCVHVNGSRYFSQVAQLSEHVIVVSPDQLVSAVMQKETEQRS